MLLMSVTFSVTYRPLLLLQATSRLRERGCDGRLAGIEVQQLFCSQSAAIPEHQLKELNMKIDSALQVSVLEQAHSYPRTQTREEVQVVMLNQLEKK